MDTLVSYVSLIALIIVVMLLIWSLILAHRDRSRKITVRGRLASLRKKIESLPDDTEENRAKKDSLYRELSLEYLENILAGIEKQKSAGDRGRKENRKRRKKKKN